MPNWKDKYKTSKDGYKKVDNILKEYKKLIKISKLKAILKEEAIKLSKLEESPVIKRMKSSEFKRNNPYNIPRNKIV